ncbi:MAG: Flp pilus assembly complex ATPase component TadA, partial [Rhodospirillales bacterium]|nr:Flp pilus assembly complex ATPase component TadA [Rhodospirillales bacterium]
MFSHFAKSGRFTQNPAPPPSTPEPAPGTDEPVIDPEQVALFELKLKLHQKLLETMNLAVIDKMTPEEFRREVGDLVRELLAEEQMPLNSRDKAQLIADILDELMGLGPLEPLLKDPTVSDILVNTARQVYVERFGKLETTGVRFSDDRHLLRIINKIVAGVGRRVDESQPLVDARLADGSRVNAVVPPVAVDGPLVSIRKFSKSPYGIDRLAEIGALTKEMAEVLTAIVKGRLNVLISGGTGSGKTTMLNALCAAVD